MSAQEVHERHPVRCRYEIEAGDLDVLRSFAPTWGLDPADFMWMGAFWFRDGTEMHTYKHRDTRRSINVDTRGQTYQFVSLSGGYQASEAADAIRWVRYGANWRAPRPSQVAP